MLNLFENRIKDVHLTKTQRKIAEYFLKNQERIGNLSSIEVAREIGVSDASIIRFSRVIGYEGFSDLKDDIYRSLANQATNGISEMKIVERYDITSQLYAQEELAKSFLEAMQYNLSRTFLQNNQEDYNKVADLMVDAKHRYVLGFRGCKGVAEHFGRLMAFMLDNTSVMSSSDPDLIGSLQGIAEHDTVIMFVFARYYKTDQEYIELAKKKGSKIVVITDSMLSPVAPYADVCLLVETKHLSFFNSAIGANLLAEYLLTLISRRTEETNRSRFEERDRLTESMRIH